jgi:hypothetical protein
MIIDLLRLGSNSLHVGPDLRKSAFVDEWRDLDLSHHFGFFFLYKKLFVVPTDGAKLLMQFPAW